MPNNLDTAKKIALWMDSKEFPLIKCFKGQMPGYSRKDFLSDLSKLPKYIQDTEESEWNEINIGRCIKGLKGLSAIKEVRCVLAALTAKITRSPAVLNAQAIGNALYGFHGMDATTLEVQGGGR